MSEKLKELVKLIKTNEEVANSSAGTNPLNHSVKMGFIKRAKENLNDLFIEYRKEVHSRAIFMLTTGSESEDFIDIAKKQFGCFAVDAEEFYYEITKDINKRLYENVVSGRNLFDLANSGFEDIALKIGIIGYTPMIFESQYKKILKNQNDMVNVIIDAFNNKTGSEVVGIYAINKVAEEAIKEGVDTKFFPIILHANNDKLLLELHKTLSKHMGKTFIISAGKVDKDIKANSTITIKSVKEDNVEKALTKIRELI